MTLLDEYQALPRAQEMTQHGVADLDGPDPHETVRLLCRALNRAVDDEYTLAEQRDAHALLAAVERDFQEGA